MSDEFLSLATKEINEELSGIEKILNSCKSDDDIYQNSSNLQRHTHKIKGLAPMMGKEELGELSSYLDIILKKITEGKKVREIFNIFKESQNQMKNSMSSTNFDLSSQTNQVKQLLSNL